MIVEGKNPDYKDVIESAQLKGRLVCQHDFWAKAKFLDYGDVILCQRCGQYFTKIKHLMWIVKGKEVPNPPDGISRMTLKPTPAHKETDVWIRVPVRITE